MLHLALTGNVAAGKSTVAALFARWGATLIDADAIVRELQRPGTPDFAAIVRRFGDAVVAPDGTLDRAALRGRVLADAAARRDLEAIVHPAVHARRELLLAEARAAGARVVLSDIPLLFEAGLEGGFDGVILVDAPPAERRRRLVAGRGLDPAEADRLIAAQLPAERKRARATWVIDNDADPAALEARARAVWEAIARRAAT